MQTVELNWNHIKNSLDELSKEIREDTRFTQNETTLDLRETLRHNLVSISDYAFDGWPTQEIIVSFDESHQGIPAELAFMILYILSFCQQVHLDITDVIKDILNERMK